MEKELATLLGMDISACEYLDPGYEGHGTDVWRVQTEKGSRVVRASRLAPDEKIEDEGGPFWGGLNRLFGHDPRDGAITAIIFTQMEQTGSFRVPHLYTRGRLGNRDAFVVEAMPGEAVKSFRSVPSEALIDFGRCLARQHGRTFKGWGNVARSVVFEADEFPRRLIDTMRFLVERWYQQDEEIRAGLEAVCEETRDLETPDEFCLVMIDQDPSQYLSDGMKITAAVDLDGMVIGPRELDWIGLEYCFDQPSASRVVEGYTSLLPMPDLAKVRRVYRYLYRLLGVQGDVPLEGWMSSPILF